MELKIKVHLECITEISAIIEEIRKIEKEYSCHCTLLEIERP